MAENIVFFDLETQRSANDVGGWAHKRDMRMSIGVTFCTSRDGYRIYTEDEAPALVDELLKAGLVVGFNVIDFDYEVLSAYTPLDLSYTTHTLDLLVDIEKVIGGRERLDNIGQATLSAGKTASGLDAVRWFREGRLREIAEYCCYDVKLTRWVYEYGRRHGTLSFIDRAGQRRMFDIRWSREVKPTSSLS